MPFLSMPHFLFVLVAAALGFVVPRRAKVVYLLALSWGWFFWFDSRFFPLLVVATVADYWVARWMEYTRREGLRGLLFGISVSLNVAIVLFFKIIFYVAKAASAHNHAPLPYEFPFMSLARWGMPLGVSFFTFHSISYVADVYRRKTPACRSFCHYALFVSFFPKIAAGPIERFSAFSRQLRENKVIGSGTILRAVRLLLAGLFLKLVVGDNLSLLVKMNFDVPAHDFFQSLLGTYAFTLQIYADFLGYTLLARGTALLFGIELSRNFASPYLARSPTDFWRRWHISLSTWFRDYVYIPLGGNRRRRSLNILVTMALAGFWHGIGLPFLLWGLYHGALLLLTKPLEPWFARLPKLAARLLTFHLVAVGWIFFRAETAAQALDVFAGFTRPGLLLGSLQIGQVSLFAWMVLPWALAAWFLSRFRRARELRWYVYADAALLGMSVVFVVTFGSISAIPFLYFKF